MAIMADSCILLDIFTEDTQWYAWSAAALFDAANAGMIIVNPVVYSEISVRLDSVEEVEDALPVEIYEYRPIPKEAAFLAGRCFAQYRRRGGERSSPLPDFFIGAHAMVESLPLITRDTKRFQTYFPTAVKNGFFFA